MAVDVCDQEPFCSQYLGSHLFTYPFFMTPNMISEDVSTLEQVKKRLAPRAGTQFRIGPPFVPTVSMCSLVTDSGRKVEPIIMARSDRGFEKENEAWIAYRRNYFSLVAAFYFQNESLEACSDNCFYCIDKLGVKHTVSYFKIGIYDVCPDTGELTNTLVQHTSKRDKGPQFDPPVYNAVLGILPLHDFMKLISNIRNMSRLHECHKKFFLTDLERQSVGKGILGNYPAAESIARVARYERMQFSKSSSQLSGVNRALKLVVRLMCVIENGESILVAAAETPTLTIRGRSPMLYIPKSLADSSFDKENLVSSSCKKRSEKSERPSYMGRKLPSRPPNKNTNSDNLPIRITIKDMISSPYESLTPKKKEYMVSFKITPWKLHIDNSLHHLVPHDPAKVSLDIPGSPMTSMPTTPVDTFEDVSRGVSPPASIHSDPMVHDRQVKLVNALKEYKQVSSQMIKLDPAHSCELDLPVPLTGVCFATETTSIPRIERSSFYRLPPQTLGQPIVHCKHGCKMRVTREMEEFLEQIKRDPDICLPTTTFFDENSDSSLLRFRNLLSRIKSQVIHLPPTSCDHALTTLTQFSTTAVEESLW